MKVYREKLNYATDSERLNVVKSIEVRRNYALIMNEFIISQSGIKRIRKNTIKWGQLTLFRIPSAMEVYASQLQSDLFSVIYKSECLSCWKILGIYFTDVSLGKEYTFIGEI